MDQFAWMSEVEELSPAALTVRAQAAPPDDNGQLIWDAFMPRSDVDSIHLREIVTPIWRPASTRREWNQRGKVIPNLTPRMKEMTMVPIESTFTVDEEEMQELIARVGSEQQRIRELLRVSIPARVDALAMANLRRIELDFAEAWANQQIIQKDPQTGATYTSSYGFDAGRYQTAGTAWNSSNAYSNFISWLQDGMRATGVVPGGVMLRQSTVNLLRASAPQGILGFELSTAQLADRIAQDLGISQFSFYINERTVHTFNDGGTEYTQTNVWPAKHVALVPQGEVVGTTAFAPVVRANNLAASVPEAGIDVRGQTVYYMSANGGRELIVEVQVNAMPVPNEQLMWVIDTQEA